MCVLYAQGTSFKSVFLCYSPPTLLRLCLTEQETHQFSKAGWQVLSICLSLPPMLGITGMLTHVCLLMLEQLIWTEILKFEDTVLLPTESSSQIFFYPQLVIIF